MHCYTVMHSEECTATLCCAVYDALLHSDAQQRWSSCLKAQKTWALTFKLWAQSMDSIKMKSKPESQNHAWNNMILGFLHCLFHYKMDWIFYNNFFNLVYSLEYTENISSFCQKCRTNIKPKICSEIVKRLCSAQLASSLKSVYFKPKARDQVYKLYF